MISFGWLALSNEYPCIFMFSSSSGIVKCGNVSGRHTMSKLLVVIKATNGTLIKSWAASPFKFQWHLFGPGLTSISPDNKSTCLGLFIKKNS